MLDKTAEESTEITVTEMTAIIEVGIGLEKVVFQKLWQ